MNLTDVFTEGERHAGATLIGAEHELLCLDQNGRVPGYGGADGIAAVLNGLSEALGWHPVREGSAVIGLEGPSASVTLEPGGQLELAGSPLGDLHAVADETRAFQHTLQEVARPLGLTFMGMGLRPRTRLCDVPMMPKSRYAIMKELMPQLGRRSLEMMFGTATIQTNLDYVDEADMAKKFRVAACWSPVVAALFANSPYQNGAPSGRMTERYAIWDHTDVLRSGRFDWMLDPQLTYHQYAEWAAAQRMLFLYRDGAYIPAPNVSFLEHARSDQFEPRDWLQHLGGVFPETRLKSFIELRSADAGCGQMVVALSALWTGLFYDQESLDTAHELTREWTSASWQNLAHMAARKGLSGRCDLGSLNELASTLVSLSAAGLGRRARRNAQGDDEQVHLAPLQRLVHGGASQAELMIDRFGDDVGAAVQFVSRDLWEFPWS